MRPSPAFAGRFLDRGRVNPMFAVHRDDLTMTVNIFNSHGRLEEDFCVDAYLYDEAGTLVAEGPRWLTATRYRVARGDIAELLSDPTRPFVGHVAAGGGARSRVLQRLLLGLVPATARDLSLRHQLWQRAAVRRPRAVHRLPAERDR